MSSESNSIDTPETAAGNRVLIGWVWRDYLKQHWRKVAIALVLMAIEGSMLGALSYIIKPMFDTVFIAGDRGAIFWVAGGIAAIFLIRAASNFGHRVLMFGVGLSVITRMQSHLVQHLLTLDLSLIHISEPTRPY